MFSHPYRYPKTSFVLKRDRSSSVVLWEGTLLTYSDENIKQCRPDVHRSLQKKTKNNNTFVITDF